MKSSKDYSSRYCTTLVPRFSKSSLHKILNWAKYGSIFTALAEAKILKVYKVLDKTEMLCKTGCLEPYSFLSCWKIYLFQDLRIQFSFMFLKPEPIRRKALPSRLLQKKTNVIYLFIHLFSCLEWFNMET